MTSERLKDAWLRDALLLLFVVAVALAIIGLVGLVHMGIEPDGGAVLARIATYSGAATIGARSAADFDAIRETAPEALAQMGDADRLLLIDHGTRVEVLREEPPRAQVRILSGAYAGATVWVSAEFLDN
jgi:hypothetical protein